NFTRISSSSSLGVGSATSPMRSTLSSPGLSMTTAFMRLEAAQTGSRCQSRSQHARCQKGKRGLEPVMASVGRRTEFVIPSRADMCEAKTRAKAHAAQLLVSELEPRDPWGLLVRWPGADRIEVRTCFWERIEAEAGFFDHVQRGPECAIDEGEVVTKHPFIFR